jgi:hypothetical protein
MREWLIDARGGNVPPENLFLLLAPDLGGAQPPAGLTHMSANYADIIRSINTLLQRSGGQGERFFFYYAGHGLMSRLNAENESGITAADFEDALTTLSIKLGTIYEKFQATQFQEQFFFIDACRNIPWEGEFNLGVIPRPGGPPDRNTSPQFILYATSPGWKASDVRNSGPVQAGNEGGAFTDALLMGLRGEGWVLSSGIGKKVSPKVWDDDLDAYVISWEGLVQFVEAEVESRRITMTRDLEAAGGEDATTAQTLAARLIQSPRQAGERGARNPELGRFPSGSFATEILDVNLVPDNLAPQTDVFLGDLGGVVDQATPLGQSPKQFLLAPRRYSIRAKAPDHAPERKYYPVDLYGPQSITVKLVRSGTREASPAPRPSPPPNEVTMLDFPARGLENVRATGGLRLRSPDPLARIELASSSGSVLFAGQGVLDFTALPVGFYRARLRGPEGNVVEQDVEVLAGEDQPPITLGAPPLPTSHVFQEVLRRAGLPMEPENTIFPSEAVGPAASVRLSTLLALAGGMVNEDTQFGEHLRGIGTPSFKEMVEGNPAEGVQVLFGIEAGPSDIIRANLERLRIRLWGLDADVPEASLSPRPFSSLVGLAAAAGALPPGPCWIAFEIPDQRPLILATTVLPGRLTLLVVHQDATTRFHFTQFLPALGPNVYDEGVDPISRMRARFPALRRLDLVERSYASQLIKQAYDYQDLKRLLYYKWIDPMAGCLGCYLSLQLLEQSPMEPADEGMRRPDQERMELLGIASGNMVGAYGSLSDSHLIRSEFHAREGSADQAVAEVRRALDHGLPIVREGLERLVAAIDRYSIEHPRVGLARALHAARVRGLLWSGAVVGELSAGAPLRFGAGGQ